LTAVSGIARVLTISSSTEGVFTDSTKSCANSQEKSRSIRYAMLMAGIRGKSGPPANQNAFKHGLAGVTQRRANGALTPDEQTIREDILAGLITDKEQLTHNSIRNRKLAES